MKLRIVNAVAQNGVNGDRSIGCGEIRPHAELDAPEEREPPPRQAI